MDITCADVFTSPKIDLVLERYKGGTDESVFIFADLPYLITKNSWDNYSFYGEQIVSTHSNLHRYEEQIKVGETFLHFLVPKVSEINSHVVIFGEFNSVYHINKL